jgi:hypothetical protein
MEVLLAVGMVYVLFKAAGFAVGALTNIIAGSAKFLAFITVAGIVYVFAQAKGLI